MHYSANLPVTSDRLGKFDRVRTETGNTSFYEGREFRLYKELNIPASGTYVMKFVVTVNVIVKLLQNDLDAGWLRLSSHILGTEGGAFVPLTLFNCNGMTGVIDKRLTFNGNATAYLPTTLVTDGGTHTGGTELDVNRIKASNNSNFSTSVGALGHDERGIPPGTYYFRFLNLSATDAITGVMHMRFEERPASAV